MATAETEKHGFQAEVKQLLDIVIHSLYTDKEIFVRELVSNAADSLEKLRLKQLTEKNIVDGDVPLEIFITTDEEKNTLTIADHGIGLTRAEAFMAADEVEVHTHSWDAENGEHLVWTSDGSTGYTIEDSSGVQRGARMVMKLKEGSEEFAKADRIKEILEKYSNFVSFPINLNGEKINKVEALWLKSKSDISDEEYAEFYKFVGKAWDEPRYTMHFSADAPLAINSLLFVPNENQEQFGMGQMESGVSYHKEIS